MRRELTAISVCLLLVLSAAAAPPTKPKDKSKPKEGTSDVKQLYGLDWHTKLETALQKAGERTGAEKPVMVLRVLGDLDGFM
jgi:hypothetical protein